MARWINDFFAAHVTSDAKVRIAILPANREDGCPVCDHPFGHLTHACISPMGAVAPAITGKPIRLPDSVVA